MRKMSYLTTKSKEELEKMLETFLKEVKELDATNIEKHIELDSHIRLIEAELLVREEDLPSKTTEELEELRHQTYRRIRRMENYDWDAVQYSSQENQDGFHREIYSLEQLAEAISLELSRRFLK